MNTTTTTTRPIEYAYRADAEGEALARQIRREMIARGANVSLIALDPTRNLYTFDLLPRR